MESKTVTVVKISKNNLEFNINDISSLDKGSLLVAIKPYIELKELDFSEMMEYVVDTIGLTHDLVADTSICYEDGNVVYQLCHLGMDSTGKEIKDEDQLNRLSSYLVYGKPKIYGDTVLLCSQIGDEGVCTPKSLVLEDVLTLLTNRLIHTCIRVEPDGTTSINQFTNTPLDNLNPKDYVFLETFILKFNLIIYLQVNPEDDSLNKVATRICGKHKINGPVLIANRVNEFDFGSIDKQLFKDIVLVTGSSIDDRNLTEEEKKDEKKNDLPVIKNSYTLLKKRLEQYKQKCGNCGCDLDVKNSLRCSGCYRLNYHSSDCQKDHWETHKSECLHRSSPVNNKNI